MYITTLGHKCASLKLDKRNSDEAKKQGLYLYLNKKQKK